MKLTGSLYGGICHGIKYGRKNKPEFMFGLILSVASFGTERGKTSSLASVGSGMALALIVKLLSRDFLDP